MESKKPKLKIFKNPLRRWGWLFLGPMAAAFIIGFVWPFIQGIYLSMCQFKTISNAKFIGLDNYVKALRASGTLSCTPRSLRSSAWC